MVLLQLLLTTRESDKASEVRMLSVSNLFMQVTQLVLLTLYRSVATLTDRKCAGNTVVLVEFPCEIVTGGLHKCHIIIGFLLTIATLR